MTSLSPRTTARAKRTTLVSAALAWTCLALSGAANARPSVLITVDVESFNNLSLPRQVNAACENDSPCGVMHMAAMMEQRGFAGVFFLNVYEQRRWGEDALRKLARALQDRGHDVALHTHPQWAYDATRPLMFEYSLEEQIRIVADGVALLQAWTGLPVVAHRAGAYSANLDTIEALARSGILLDSSLFLRHPRSRLNGLGLPANLPSRIGSVLEIPVTVYQRREHPSGIGRILPRYVATGKLDVDSIATPAQAAAAFDAVADANFPYIVLFLHSFSFIQPPEASEMPLRADTASMEVFTALLDAVSRRALPVVTTRSLLADPGAIAAGVADHKDSVPQVDIPIPALKYVARMARSHSALAATAAGILMLAACILLLLDRRRRIRRAAGPEG